ncbi:Receptor-like serine/threonine-protein kinase SD1-7, partial [Mucuna pruriens]
MSPEYAMEGIFSTKSDVYSFGVLLLEIVSGRRNTSFYDDDRPLNLIGHVCKIIHIELFFGTLFPVSNLTKIPTGMGLVDQSLNESFDLDEVQRCIHVGLLCVEQYANDRPTMTNIIAMLTNKSATVSLPQRPAFYVGRKTFGEKSSSKELCTDSIIEITASLEIESS